MLYSRKPPLSNLKLFFQVIEPFDDEESFNESFVNVLLISPHFLEKYDTTPSKVVEKYIELLAIYGYDVIVKDDYETFDMVDEDGDYDYDYMLPIEIVF